MPMKQPGVSFAQSFQQHARELRRIGDDVVVGHGDERRGRIGLHRDDHAGLLRGHELAGVAVDAQRQVELRRNAGSRQPDELIFGDPTRVQCAEIAGDDAAQRLRMSGAGARRQLAVSRWPGWGGL